MTSTMTVSPDRVQEFTSVIALVNGLEPGEPLKKGKLHPWLHVGLPAYFLTLKLSTLRICAASTQMS